MKAESREDYIKNMIEIINQSELNDTRILKRGECEGIGSMLLVGKPHGSSMYRCEITLTYSGHLTLTGDLTTVCWARYSRKTMEGAIAWMGAEKFNSSYMGEKAGLGMGRRLEKYEPSVALDDIDDKIAQVQEFDNQEAVEMWTEIRELAASNASKEEVQTAIYKKTDDAEEVNVGMVPDPSLMWGWGMLRHVRRLLENKKGKLMTIKVGYIVRIVNQPPTLGYPLAGEVCFVEDVQGEYIGVTAIRLDGSVRGSRTVPIDCLEIETAPEWVEASKLYNFKISELLKETKRFTDKISKRRDELAIAYGITAAAIEDIHSQMELVYDSERS